MKLCDYMYYVFTILKESIKFDATWHLILKKFYNFFDANAFETSNVS